MPPSIMAAERRAREFLTQGKWRKARDEVKPLVRAFRAQFLPLLIEANVGLAREMASKGQLAEARQVMAYLATIAPPEQIRALELETSARSLGEGAVVAKCLGLLAGPQANLPESVRLRLADQAVLAFEAAAEPDRGPGEGADKGADKGPDTGADKGRHEGEQAVLAFDLATGDTPAAAGLPAAGRRQEACATAEDAPAAAGLPAQVRAVQDALAAAGSVQWDRVPELLRAIPFRSPFSHWGVFIKGLAAFHTGDPERAVRLFASLPKDSAPGRASNAYLVLAGRARLDSRTPFLEATLGAVCRLLGLPGFAATLVRAERLWQEGRHAHSYRILRDAVPQFPSGGLDPLGALSEFYFQAPFMMTGPQQADYLDYFEATVYPAPKNAVEDMLGSRMLALTGEHSATLDLLSSWQKFLDARAALYTPDPHLAALAYASAGEKLAQPRPPSAFSRYPDRPRMVNAAAARKCLEKAVESDPAHLPAYLLLCKVLETLNHTAERNRLLDEMTRRFPEEKPVLVESARHCLERKAFTKALDLLEAASRLDRLDPHIPELMLLARIRLARRYFQDKHAAKARQVLEAAEPLLTDQPDDFLRSRWTALTRRGLLEQAYGDPDQAKTLLERALSTSPFRAAFLFFAHLTHRVYTLERFGNSPFAAGVGVELARGPSAAQAGLLLRLYLYWESAPDKPSLDTETKWLRKLLSGLAKRGTTREEARQLAELCGTEPRFAEQAQALVRSVLRKDRADPLFRLLELGLRDEDPYGRPADRPELASILQEARRRGDQEAIQRAERTLRSLDHPPPRPIPDFSDFEKEDDFDDEEPEFDGPALGGPDPRELREMMAMLAGASPAELAQFRRTVAGDMPQVLFDMMVKAAKTGKPPRFPGPPFL